MTKSSGRAAAGAMLALVLAVPAAAQDGQLKSGATTPVRVITDTAGLLGPRQPIFFRHDIHAGPSKIACLYCHNTVAVSSEPGIPSLQTCIGCHLIIVGRDTMLGSRRDSSNRVEIKKVREAWSNRKPPEWIRIHTVPGFVRFPHMRHIKVLGVESCQTCHGDVATMPQVYQVETLKMGWCISCHVQRRATRDCTACHY